MATIEPAIINKFSFWMFFLGALLFLMGLYGFIRVAHVSLRHVPYPINGVLPATILTPEISNNWAHESDCDPYPQLYQDVNGKPREATQEEISQAQKLTDRCIQGFEEDRAKQKQRDKNESAFLVFVGAGLVFARRFLDAT